MIIKKRNNELNVKKLRWDSKEQSNEKEKDIW